jgi:serine phosphatase RsbU (regulator of sigma subunit)
MLRKGDIIYMATDGLVDIANPDRISFSSLRLKQFLAVHYHLPLSEQKEALEKEIDNFRQGVEQRDDVTFVCVKI